MRKAFLTTAAVVAFGAAAMTGAMAASHGGGSAGFAHGGGGMGMHSMASPGASNMAMPRGNTGGNFAPNTARNNFNAPQGNFAQGRNHDHGRRGYGGYGYGGLYAFGGPDYYDYDYYAGDSCWQRQLVPTPYGLRWRLVDVCE